MARGKGKKVIFVIPAFNEAPVIANVINGLKKTLKKSADYRYEILVVDDGSMDNTYIRAKDTGAKVIRHILNSGVGHATATGMLYALKHDFDIMVTLDADGQHTPEDAISGVENLLKDRCDLLIGSRLIDPTGMYYRLTVWPKSFFPQSNGVPYME
jgi:glycosyltransferase involved in cell wall biosynthesis